MARTRTFFEMLPPTKRKWEKYARKAAAYANYLGIDGKSSPMLKDEVKEHIKRVFIDEGAEYSELRGDYYLEMVKMASVFSGPDIPTLDLIRTDDGMGYHWIQDGSLPSGSLKHNLRVASGFPRLNFDYFVLTGQHYGVDELIDAIGGKLAMKLLLDAEFFVRIQRAENKYTVKELEGYLKLLAAFKEDVQTKISREETAGFNALAQTLLLGVPAAA